MATFDFPAEESPELPELYPPQGPDLGATSSYRFEYVRFLRAAKERIQNVEELRGECLWVYMLYVYRSDQVADPTKPLGSYIVPDIYLEEQSVKLADVIKEHHRAMDHPSGEGGPSLPTRMAELLDWNIELKSFEFYKYQTMLSQAGDMDQLFQLLAYIYGEYLRKERMLKLNIMPFLSGIVPQT